MARVVLLLAVVSLAWLAIRILAGRRRDAPPPTETSQPTKAEPVAQCAWCGAHAPTASAVRLPDGRVYCGDAHREAARIAQTGSS